MGCRLEAWKDRTILVRAWERSHSWSTLRATWGTLVDLSSAGPTKRNWQRWTMLPSRKSHYHTSYDSLQWLRQWSKYRLISRMYEAEWDSHWLDINPLYFLLSFICMRIFCLSTQYLHYQGKLYKPCYVYNESQQI